MWVLVTCYFRYLKGVFEKAGVEMTSENKKDVDKIIHSIVRKRYKNCPATWKEVKKRIAEDLPGFASELRSRWQKATAP